jgi:homoserine O-acetyltransferase
VWSRPSAGEAAGAGFPAVSIGDDVVAQHRLVTEVFGIQRLALVRG